MKSLFRSRLPRQLTLSQISELSNESNFSSEEIQEWYQRFVLCYPYGYLSSKEFLIYLKQLNAYNGNQQKQLSNLIIKQLFRTFDLNEDKQLNFKEFFHFNLLITHGSKEDKLKLILNLYDQEQKKYYTEEKIVNILTHLFHLLNIPEPVNCLSERVDAILTHLSFNNRNNKICWMTFCTSVLKHSFLFEIFLSNHFYEETLITRL